MDIKQQNIEAKANTSNNKTKNITLVFLSTGILSFLYSLYLVFFETMTTPWFLIRDLINNKSHSYLTKSHSIYINVTVLIVIAITLLLSFLPHYLTRQYIKYKNAHSTRQLVLGIISTIIIQLIILMFLSFVSQDKYVDQLVYPTEGGLPSIPCIPNEKARIVCD